jgi:hypothetical protein
VQQIARKRIETFARVRVGHPGSSSDDCQPPLVLPTILAGINLHVAAKYAWAYQADYRSLTALPLIAVPANCTMASLSV